MLDTELQKQAQDEPWKSKQDDIKKGLLASEQCKHQVDIPKDYTSMIEESKGHHKGGLQHRPSRIYYINNNTLRNPVAKPTMLKRFTQL